MIPETIYNWTARDRFFYAVSMIPFLVAFFGAIYLLWAAAWYLGAIFIGLYLAGNVFQAGACTGCPYRGKYCPPIFGVYLGNILSGVLYPNRGFDADFIARQAKIAEYVVYVTLLFPLYWLYLSGWWVPLGYAGLLLLHLVLFMPVQCKKCSYHNVCPGGIAWQGFKKRFCP